MSCRFNMVLVLVLWTVARQCQGEHPATSGLEVPIEDLDQRNWKVALQTLLLRWTEAQASNHTILLNRNITFSRNLTTNMPESHRPSREDMIQFFETIADINQNISNSHQCIDYLMQNISNTHQCIKDAIQRGQCREEVIEDSIDKLENIRSSLRDIVVSIAEALEDIRNIMNSLQDGSCVDQIIFSYPGGFRTMTCNMLSMKATLREIQDDIQESEEASRNMENAAIAILLLTLLLRLLLIQFISF